MTGGLAIPKRCMHNFVLIQVGQFVVGQLKKLAKERQVE